MNNEQKRLIRDLLEREKDDVRDGIALTDDNRTVEQELEFIDELLADEDLQMETCTAAYVAGTANPDAEQFASDCDRDPGHSGPHEGPCPFGTEQRVSWEGGGFCAGDPLPYRNVTYTG